MNWLLSWTIYFGASDEQLVKATSLLIGTTDFFAVTFTSMSLCLNTALCIDLILMVRYPFDKKENRVIVYLVVSGVISVLIAFGTVIFTLSPALVGTGILLQAIVTSVFVITFVTSVCYTCSKLSGPGMSKEVRGLVLNRHIATMVIYLVCNLYVFISYFAMLIPSMRDDFFS